MLNSILKVARERKRLLSLVLAMVISFGMFNLFETSVKAAPTTITLKDDGSDANSDRVYLHIGNSIGTLMTYMYSDDVNGALFCLNADVPYGKGYSATLDDTDPKLGNMIWYLIETGAYLNQDREYQTSSSGGTYNAGTYGITQAIVHKYELDEGKTLNTEAKWYFVEGGGDPNTPGSDIRRYLGDNYAASTLVLYNKSKQFADEVATYALTFVDVESGLGKISHYKKIGDDLYYMTDLYSVTDNVTEKTVLGTNYKLTINDANIKIFDSSYTQLTTTTSMDFSDTFRIGWKVGTNPTTKTIAIEKDGIPDSTMDRYVVGNGQQDMGHWVHGEKTVEATKTFTIDTIDKTIQKVDGAKPSTLLSGAKFKIFSYDRDDQSEKIDLNQELTTGEDGKATFTGLLPGLKHTIEEIQAPANYLVMDDEYIQLLPELEAGEIRIGNEKIKEPVVEKTVEEKLEFQLVNRSDEFTYDVTYDFGNLSNGDMINTTPKWKSVTLSDSMPSVLETRSVKLFTTTVVENVVDGKTVKEIVKSTEVPAERFKVTYPHTDKTTEVNVEMLPVGVSSNANFRYLRDQTYILEIKAKVKESATASDMKQYIQGTGIPNKGKLMFDNNPKISNEVYVHPPKKARIYLGKYDVETKTPLNGAKFEIYNNSKELVDTITTDSTGYATSKELEYGYYTVTEVETPEGFSILNKTQEIHIDETTVEYDRDLKVDIYVVGVANKKTDKPDVEKTVTDEDQIKVTDATLTNKNEQFKWNAIFNFGNKADEWDTLSLTDSIEKVLEVKEVKIYQVDEVGDKKDVTNKGDLSIVKNSTTKKTDITFTPEKDNDGGYTYLKNQVYDMEIICIIPDSVTYTDLSEYMKKDGIPNQATLFFDNDHKDSNTPVVHPPTDVTEPVKKVSDENETMVDEAQLTNKNEVFQWVVQFPFGTDATTWKEVSFNDSIHQLLNIESVKIYDKAMNADGTNSGNDITTSGGALDIKRTGALDFINKSSVSYKLNSGENGFDYLVGKTYTMVIKATIKEAVPNNILTPFMQLNKGIPNKARLVFDNDYKETNEVKVIPPENPEEPEEPVIKKTVTDTDQTDVIYGELLNRNEKFTWNVWYDFKNKTDDWKNVVMTDTLNPILDVTSAKVYDVTGIANPSTAPAALATYKDITSTGGKLVITSIEIDGVLHKQVTYTVADKDGNFMYLTNKKYVMVIETFIPATVTETMLSPYKASSGIPNKGILVVDNKEITSNETFEKPPVEPEEPEIPTTPKTPEIPTVPGETPPGGTIIPKLPGYKYTYNPDTDEYTIYDNDTPLGTIKLPKGTTIDELENLDDLIPFGKPNPKTIDQFNYVLSGLVLAVSTGGIFILRKKKLLAKNDK